MEIPNMPIENKPEAMPPKVTELPMVKPWQSKTLWVSAISALLPVIFPPAGVWIAANPEVASALYGLLFGGLRVITKGQISVLD